METLFTYQYLPWRGVSDVTFQYYDVKTKIAPNGEPLSVGYRYPNGSYKVRYLDKKDFYSEGEISRAGLFGRDKFSAGAYKYVTITEGELDALSLYEVLKAPVVSVQSSVTANRDCAIDREWLNSFERIYIAFDNDTAGRDAARSVARLFDYNKVYQLKFSKYKDANDYLQYGEAEDLRKIWWNSKKYLPETIISSFSDFKTILSTSHQLGIPYPFKKLTDMTYGIRTGESVLVTAQEGVGKTELMHAIEYQLLKETKENVGVIHLEEPKKRLLQSLAGIALKKAAHLPDSGCTDDEVYRAVEELISEDDRLHIYNHFGSDDPEILLDAIRFLVSARGCRYVGFDHISMGVSGLAGESDERRALDYLSTRLQMMVKELDFALIMVSHVNDFGQTRGSRYISKVADLRIDLTRDIKSDDWETRNTTHLLVSKNRFSGRTGNAGSLLYDQVTSTYTELTEEGIRNEV